MKIPVWLATIIVTASFSVWGWMALQIIEMRSDIAGIKATLVALHAEVDPFAPKSALTAGR